MSYEFVQFSCVTTAALIIATTNAAANTQTNTQTAVLCFTSARYECWLQARHGW